MKTNRLTLLLAFLTTVTFSGCNANKPKSIDNAAHQQVNNTHSLPTISSNNRDTNCLNCRATFKLSKAVQKYSNGNNYIECPVCHKDYLKKSK